MNGWFLMNRAMFEHPIFAGKPERIAAWTWLIAAAAWKDTRQDANGKTVTVKRGQILTSYRQMSKATGVSVKALRTLIDRLQAEGAIGTDTGTGRLLISIRNYDKYQATPEGRAQHTAQEGHSKGTQKKEGNNIPVGERADAPPDDDPAKVIFSTGRRLLTDAGYNSKQAGSILGRWRREHGDGAVIDALSRAQREGASQPVEFIQGCLRWRQAQSPADKMKQFYDQVTA